MKVMKAYDVTPMAVKKAAPLGELVIFVTESLVVYSTSMFGI